MLEWYRVQQHKDRNRLSHVCSGIPVLAPGVCRPVFTCVPPPGDGVSVPHCASASALGCRGLVPKRSISGFQVVACILCVV